MSSQKTRHQKLNSYWVMNSLGDKICPPAAPSTPESGPQNQLFTHDAIGSLQVLSFKQLIDRGGCHAWGRVC